MSDVIEGLVITVFYGAVIWMLIGVGSDWGKQTHQEDECRLLCNAVYEKHVDADACTKDCIAAPTTVSWALKNLEIKSPKGTER